MEKMKIFVSVGSQKFQFDRLIKLMDDEVLNQNYEIFMQIGYCNYKPKNCKFIDFLDRDSLLESIKNSDIIVCHGGTGIIVSSLKNNKKVIAIPRLKKYGEHVDDHQKEIIKVFKEKNYLYSIDEIVDINQVINDAVNKRYSLFISNTDNFIKNLENLLLKI